MLESFFKNFVFPLDYKIFKITSCFYIRLNGLLNLDVSCDILAVQALFSYDKCPSSDSFLKLLSSKILNYRISIVYTS